MPNTLLDSVAYLAASAPTIDPGEVNARRLSEAATAKLQASRSTAKRPINFPTWAEKPQRHDPWESVQRKLGELDKMAETLIELRDEIARLAPEKAVAK